MLLNYEISWQVLTSHHGKNLIARDEGCNPVYKHHPTPLVKT